MVINTKMILRNAFIFLSEKLCAAVLNILDLLSEISRVYLLALTAANYRKWLSGLNMFI